MRLPVSLPRLLLSGILLPIVTFFVLGTWLLMTQSGAQWILEQIPHLRVQKVQGNLLQGLQLTAVDFQQGSLHFHAERLAWQLEARAILWGELDLSHIVLQHAVLWLPPAKPATQPLSLTMPPVPTWSYGLALRLHDVSIRDVALRQGGKELLAIRQGGWRDLAWFHGQLRAREVHAQSNLGLIHLEATLWPGRSIVHAHGRWTQEQQQVDVQVDWQSLGKKHYGGPILVNYREGRERSRLEAIARLAPHSLHLAKVQLSNPALARPVQGFLALELPRKLHGKYQTQGRLGPIVWREAPKSLQAFNPVVQWQAQGQAQSFQGKLALLAQQNQLHVQFHSAAQKLQLRLQGTLGRGRILPSAVAIGLGPKHPIEGTLQFRELPWSLLAPKLTGQLSTDLQIQAQSLQGHWLGKVQWQILPSRMEQQSFQGSGALQFAGSQWTLEKALLVGPGLQVSADGSLQKKLQIQAAVHAWAGIAPGVSGSSTLQGWVSQRGKNWSGALQLTGTDLSYGKIAIASLGIQGALQNDQGLRVQLNAHELRIQGQKLSLQGNLQGTLQQARVKLQAQEQDRQLEVGGDVRHQGSSWTLFLHHLRFQDPKLGLWRLQDPSQWSWQDSTIAVSSFQVDGEQGASLALAGSWNIQRQQGQVQAKAHELPLDFWNVAMDTGVRGRWNAALQAHCAGVCQVQGDWDVVHTQVHWQQGEHQQVVALRRFGGELYWGNQGLQAQAELALGENLGHLALTAHSPAVLRLPWKGIDNAPLDAKLHGMIPGLLLAKLPTGNIQIESAGQIQLGLQVAGTVGKPQWQGQAQATGLGCYIPQAGLHLQDISATVQGSGDQLLLQQAQIHSGSGVLQAHGQFSWAKGMPYQLQVGGKNFLALNLPQVKASVDPHLKINHRDGIVHVDGDLHTTSLRILGTDFGGPKPSSDVVFVHQQVQKTTPSHLEANVKIDLGKDAKILIGGLEAGLEGTLQLRVTPPSTTPDLEGSLHMVHGSYQIYGNSLTFKKGAILFHGNPQEASLDVLAVRTIKVSNSFAVNNEPVEAGVRVTGTLSHPVVSLYSQPSMAQNDILSYLVLGTPSSGLQSQDAVLSAAAGELFSAGRAAVFGNGLQSGFDLGVSSSGNGNGGLAGDMVTLGHYITPNLYFSVGQSIFGQGTIARLRYRVSRHIELQTESGTQDGANIFYRIDF